MLGIVHLLMNTFMKLVLLTMVLLIGYCTIAVSHGCYGKPSGKVLVHLIAGDQMVKLRVNTLVWNKIIAVQNPCTLPVLDSLAN